MAEHDTVQAIGSLADPVRRELYDYIASQNDSVSREDAAAAVGVAVHKAKFHLERLVQEGLLDTEFKRLTGKTGPGAGRPAKLYRRARSVFSVSLPERRYDLMGHILAEAIENTHDGCTIHDVLDAVARSAGEHAALSARPLTSDGDPDQQLREVSDELSQLGYEPETADEVIRLRNCPFDTLAKQHTELVCGVNRSYVQGVIDGIGARGVCTCADKQTGYCCVAIRAAQADTE